MKRAFILLLDSLGVGELPDAAKFGDEGANTLLHIAETCAAGKADIMQIRKGILQLPNLARLGLSNLLFECSGHALPGFDPTSETTGLYGYAAEKSFGKDTPSGHWEIAGVPVLFDWGYFPKQIPCFPPELIAEFIKQAKLPGILGNKHASGTEIIKEFGDEHVKTKKPICYTSADSVFQIAAHEEAFGLNRLYEICKVAYELLKPYNIGRVIARPFAGTSGNYARTEHRRDYSIPPPGVTLLEKLVKSGGTTIAIGKIADIFAHCGISQHVDAHGHVEIFQAACDATKSAKDRSLVFANFVDFDMKYGHRRDIAGYAHALEEFDSNLPRFVELMQPGDIAIITADHGCDPTFAGTDHTREYIPVLAFGPGIKGGALGRRDTFADIGQSLAKYFDLEPFQTGKAFL
ncbi:MAG: phosphopentomutase [Gammaproteobacteria bacterium]|nr:phosphopentomutase [Gammaproteobacteria bacterium]